MKPIPSRRVDQLAETVRDLQAAGAGGLIVAAGRWKRKGERTVKPDAEVSGPVKGLGLRVGIAGQILKILETDGGWVAILATDPALLHMALAGVDLPRAVTEDVEGSP